MSQKQDTNMEKKTPKNFQIASCSVAIVFAPTGNRSGENSPGRKIRNGKDLYKELMRENRNCVWNKTLAESIRGLTFVGYLEPLTLLVKGNEKHMETVRDAYSRRILKPPRNFAIAHFGDVPEIELSPVPQAQFIPLTEVLCLIVSEMNRRKITATQESIRNKLAECYSKMPLPNPEIIHKSLAYLAYERKIEYNGNGYQILRMDDLECILTTDVDDTSVITTRTKKKDKETKVDKEEKKDGKIYLVYKDGVLTKHTLPEKVFEQTDAVTARPISYPANDAIGTITENRTGFQRSVSMRERRGNGSRSNFERTHSMRVPPADVNGYDAGYITSDSEVKQSCLGRLLSKSYQKKPIKQQPAKPKIITFQAQFPPSDVHDPFFSYAHWADKHPDKAGKEETDNKLEEKREERKGKGKSSGKDGTPQKQRKMAKDSSKHTTQHHKLDHGRLTMTAQSLQQKYQENTYESMPESESEFLKPTQMYDNRFRTKAVAEQTQVCKSTQKKNPPPKECKDPKNDKIAHFFNSMEQAMPHNPKPFQGLTDDGRDYDLDHIPSKDVTGTKIKNGHRAVTLDAKERRQARVFADAKLSDMESEELSNTASSVTQDTVISRKAAPQEQIMKRPGRAVAIHNSDLSLAHTNSETSSNQESIVPSNQSQTLPADKSKSSSVSRYSQYAKASNVDYKDSELKARTEALVNKRPKSYAATSDFQVSSRAASSARKSVHESFYGDEEIDVLMKDELKKDKTRRKRDKSPNLNKEGLRPSSRTSELDNTKQNEINRQIEGKESASSSERGSFRSNSTNDHIEVGDSSSIAGNSQNSSVHRSPNQNSDYSSMYEYSSSDVTRNTVGSNQNAQTSQPITHHKVESLLGMTDSGFNSPRSSFTNSKNSSPSPVPNPVKAKVVLLTPSNQALVKPIPRKAPDAHPSASNGQVQNGAVFAVYHKPVSSPSDNSSSSEITVKSQIHMQHHLSPEERSDDNLSSSDKGSSRSSHSRGGQGGNSGGANSFEVIGTV